MILILSKGATTVFASIPAIPPEINADPDFTWSLLRLLEFSLDLGLEDSLMNGNNNSSSPNRVLDKKLSVTRGGKEGR